MTFVRHQAAETPSSGTVVKEREVEIKGFDCELYKSRCTKRGSVVVC